MWSLICLRWNFSCCTKPVRLGWLASKTQAFTCLLPSQIFDYKSVCVCVCFCVKGHWELNLGGHVCKESIVLTELSFQPSHFFCITSVDLLLKIMYFHEFFENPIQGILITITPHFSPHFLLDLLSIAHPHFF